MGWAAGFPEGMRTIECSGDDVFQNTELTFRAGEMILVYGDVDEDGFYLGELDGKKGLLPSNFLEPFSSAALAQQQV